MKELQRISCVSFYENPGKIAKDNGYAFAAGLASWPYLDFGKAEIEDCVPQGALNTAFFCQNRISGFSIRWPLNISADRRFSLGDIFGAVAEYHQGPSGRPGQCHGQELAQGLHGSPKRLRGSQKIVPGCLKRRDDKVLAAKICYNLGAVAQNLGETRGALQYWRKCAAFAPGHGWCLDKVRAII